MKVLRFLLFTILSLVATTTWAHDGVVLSGDFNNLTAEGTGTFNNFDMDWNRDNGTQKWYRCYVYGEANQTYHFKFKINENWYGCGGFTHINQGGVSQMPVENWTADRENTDESDNITITFLASGYYAFEFESSSHKFNISNVGTTNPVTKGIVTNYASAGTPLTTDNFKALAGTGAHFGLMAVSENAATYHKWFGFVSENSRTDNIATNQLFTLTANGTGTAYNIQRVSDGQYASGAGTAPFKETATNISLINRTAGDYAAEYTADMQTSLDNKATGGYHINANSYAWGTGTGGWSCYVAYGPFYVVTVNIVNDVTDAVIETKQFIVHKNYPFSHNDVDGDLPASCTYVSGNGGNVIADATYNFRYTTQDATFTYNFTLNGNSICTKEFTILAGETFPVVEEPYGVTFTNPTGTVATSDNGRTIDIPVTCTLPFKFYSSYNNVEQWYRLKIKSTNYLEYTGATQEKIELGVTTATASDGFAWGFVGNPFDGFRIVNHKAGNGYILSSANPEGQDSEGGYVYPLVKEEASLPSTNNTVWNIKAGNNLTSFELVWGNTNHHVNARPYTGNAVAYWTGQSATTTDDGSEFTIEEAYLIEGTITNAAGGAAISGATVTYNGTDVTTNASGKYGFFVNDGTSSSITASADGYISKATGNVTVAGTNLSNKNIALSTTIQDGIYIIKNTINSRGTIVYNDGYADTPILANVTLEGYTDAERSLPIDASYEGQYWYIKTVGGDTYFYNVGGDKFLASYADIVAGFSADAAALTLSKVSITSPYYNIKSGDYYLSCTCGRTFSEGDVRWLGAEPDANSLTLVALDNGSTTYATDIATADALIAASNNKVDVTYNYKLNGTTLYSEVFSCVVGKAYPAGTKPYGINYTAPTGTVSVAETKNINVTLSITYPITFADSYENINNWYYFKLNDKYIPASTTSPTTLQDATTTADSNKWAFVGNPYIGYTIYNKQFGEGYKFASVDPTTDTTNDGGNVKTYLYAADALPAGFTSWRLVEGDGTSAGVFQLAWGNATGKRMNNRDNTVSFWNTSHGNGSNFTVESTYALTGTVTADGNAAAGITVTDGTCTAVTDAAGKYTMYLPNGTYTVSATAAGYSTDSHEVTIADADANQDFAITFSVASQGDVYTGLTNPADGLYVIRCGAKGSTGYIMYDNDQHKMDTKKTAFHNLRIENADLKYVWKLVNNGETFTLQNMGTGQYFAATSDNQAYISHTGATANLKIKTQTTSENTLEHGFFIYQTNNQVDSKDLNVHLNTGSYDDDQTYELGYWNDTNPASIGSFEFYPVTLGEPVWGTVGATVTDVANLTDGFYILHTKSDKGEGHIAYREDLGHPVCDKADNTRFDDSKVMGDEVNFVWYLENDPTTGTFTLQSFSTQDKHFLSEQVNDQVNGYYMSGDVIANLVAEKPATANAYALTNSFYLKQTNKEGWYIHINKDNSTVTTNNIAYWNDTNVSIGNFEFIPVDPKAVLTYIYKYNGGKARYHEFNDVSVGDAYPKCNYTVPCYGVSYTQPTGKVTTTNEKKVIDLVSSLPFESAETFAGLAKTKWYSLKIYPTGTNGKYLHYEEGQKSVASANITDTPSDVSYAWGFVGNPFDGFRIVNFIAGDGNILSANNNTYDGNTGGSTYAKMEEEATLPNTKNTTWFIGKPENSDQSKYIQIQQNSANAHFLNLRDGEVAFWVNGHDVGSDFLIEPYTDFASYTISGKVTDEDGKGLIWAAVTIGNQCVNTDGSGNYTISGVYAGKHTIKVDYFGYDIVEESISVVASATKNYTLTASTDVAYTLKIGTKSTTFAGSNLYEDSGDLKHSKTEAPSVFVVERINQAYFRIKHLDSGKYITYNSPAFTLADYNEANADAFKFYAISHPSTIAGFKGTYSFRLGTASLSAKNDGTLNTQATYGNASPESWWVVSPTSTITGTITDFTTQAPVENATVSIDGRNITTDAAGQYTMEYVAQGNHTITLSADGYAPLTLTNGLSVTTTATTKDVKLVPLPTAGVNYLLSCTSTGHGNEKYMCDDGTSLKGTSKTASYFQFAPVTGGYNILSAASGKYVNFGTSSASLAATASTVWTFVTSYIEGAIAIAPSTAAAGKALNNNNLTGGLQLGTCTSSANNCSHWNMMGIVSSTDISDGRYIIRNAQNVESSGKKEIFLTNLTNVMATVESDITYYSIWEVKQNGDGTYTITNEGTRDIMRPTATDNSTNKGLLHYGTQESAATNLHYRVGDATAADDYASFRIVKGSSLISGATEGTYALTADGAPGVFMTLDGEGVHSSGMALFEKDGVTWTKDHLVKASTVDPNNAYSQYALWEFVPLTPAKEAEVFKHMVDNLVGCVGGIVTLSNVQGVDCLNEIKTYTEKAAAAIAASTEGTAPQYTFSADVKVGTTTKHFGDGKTYYTGKDWKTIGTGTQNVNMFHKVLDMIDVIKNSATNSKYYQKLVADGKQPFFLENICGTRPSYEARLCANATLWGTLDKSQVTANNTDGLFYATYDEVNDYYTLYIMSGDTKKYLSANNGTSQGNIHFVEQTTEATEALHFTIEPVIPGIWQMRDLGNANGSYTEYTSKPFLTIQDTYQVIHYNVSEISTLWKFKTYNTLTFDLNMLINTDGDGKTYFVNTYCQGLNLALPEAVELKPYYIRADDISIDKSTGVMDINLTLAPKNGDNDYVLQYEQGFVMMYDPANEADRTAAVFAEKFNNHPIKVLSEGIAPGSTYDISEDNMLVGTLTGKTVETFSDYHDTYVLAYKANTVQVGTWEYSKVYGKGLGFYHLKMGQSIPANKAYLSMGAFVKAATGTEVRAQSEFDIDEDIDLDECNEDSNPLVGVLHFLNEDGTETAIEVPIIENATVEDLIIRDLQGREVVNPVKGQIYIIGGKKVLF